MSNLLISEPPLQVLPSLAEEIGLNEAILLQQVHYWLLRSTNVREGPEGQERKWVYKTYSGWQEELSFWSEHTIRRTLSSLEEQGLITVEQMRLDEGDPTPWYTINYRVLEKLEAVDPPSGQSGQRGVSKMDRRGVQNGQKGGGGYAHARAETTTENTTETNSRAPAREDSDSKTEGQPEEAVTNEKSNPARSGGSVGECDGRFIDDWEDQFPHGESVDRGDIESFSENVRHPYSEDLFTEALIESRKSLNQKDPSNLRGGPLAKTYNRVYEDHAQTGSRSDPVAQA